MPGTIPLRMALGSATSAIGFERAAGGARAEWDRYLTLDGKRAHHIGNTCNTCAFFFERLGGANRSVECAELADALAGGLRAVDRGVAEQVGLILPTDDYVISLQSPLLRAVRPGDNHDYFAEEQIALWGVDGFWNLPHDPRTEYYRGREADIGGGGRLYEFVVPMFPRTWLDDQTIASYSARPVDLPPTALAISVLDVKQPAVRGEGKAITEHWCLTHYLLDGHHKAAAALAAQRRASILSFLAVAQGISSPEQAARALGALATIGELS